MGSWFHTILNANSSTRHQNVVEAHDKWSVSTLLRVQPKIQELVDVIRGLATERLLVLLNYRGAIEGHFQRSLYPATKTARHRHRYLKGEEFPQQWKEATTKVLHKTKDRTEYGYDSGMPLVAHAGKIMLNTVALYLNDYCERVRLLSKKQRGFRPNHFTTDMMFVIRRQIRQYAYLSI